MNALVSIPADSLAEAFDEAVRLWNDGLRFSKACHAVAASYAAQGYEYGQILAFLTAEGAYMRRLVRSN